MSVLRHLAEKPWLTPQSAAEAPATTGRWPQPSSMLGLWVFLSVVTMLFLLLIVAYGSRMAFEDWRPGPELGLLWFNTMTLLASSIAMQWARAAARRGQVGDAWPGLLTGGGLALVFLVGQVLAWLQLRGMGAFGVTIPSVAFFYLITGLHALHLAGGLVAWARTAAKVLSGGDEAQVRHAIELTTTYLHFMLVVWLVLFGLLFSGNNMSALLAICGLR